MRVKVWIPVLAVILVAVGLAVFLAWQRWEEPSKVVAPAAVPPTEATPSPPGIVWNVPLGSVAPGVENEIRKSINTDPFLISAGREEDSLGEFISIETIEVEGEWAVVDYAARYKKTNEFVPSEGVFVLLRKTDHDWEVIHTGDRKFCQLLPLVPDSLIPSGTKAFYQDLCQQ